VQPRSSHSSVRKRTPAVSFTLRTNSPAPPESLLADDATSWCWPLTTLPSRMDTGRKITPMGIFAAERARRLPACSTWKDRCYVSSSDLSEVRQSHLRGVWKSRRPGARRRAEGAAVQLPASAEALVVAVRQPLSAQTSRPNGRLQLAGGHSH